MELIAEYLPALLTIGMAVTGATLLRIGAQRHAERERERRSKERKTP